MLRGHNAFVWSVAFSPDGQRLASASADQMVKIWNAMPRQALKRENREPAKMVRLAPPPVWSG